MKSEYYVAAIVKPTGRQLINMADPEAMYTEVAGLLRRFPTGNTIRDFILAVQFPDL